MSVDELTRLLLTLAFVFAISIIAYQLARLIGKLADTVQDSRQVVNDAGKMTTMFTQDYDELRVELKRLIVLIKSLVDALSGIGGIASFISNFTRSGNDSGKKRNSGVGPEIEY